MIFSKMSNSIFTNLDTFNNFSKPTLIEAEYNILKRMNYICAFFQLDKYLAVLEFLTKPLPALSRM